MATVDRVLNARAGVRARTVERVNSAIQRLGYVRDIAAANLARRRQYRFVFLIPDAPSQFLKGLREAIDEASAVLMTNRSDVQTIPVAFQDAAALTRVFTSLELSEVDGVAIMADETPMVRDLIARLKSRGVAVVALITDQPKSQRDHFVGINNLAAGRTAGVLMGRFAGAGPGKVAVVVNSMQASDMVQRRMGFDEVIGEQFPGLTTLPSLEGRDDHALTAQVMSRCLEDNDGIIGIYCAGAGMRGVTQTLKDRGLGDRLILVGHDLTPHSRQELNSGVVDVIINQNAGHIARSATRILRAQCDGVDFIPSQEEIRIEVILKENMPWGTHRPGDIDTISNLREETT